MTQQVPAFASLSSVGRAISLISPWDTSLFVKAQIEVSPFDAICSSCGIPAPGLAYCSQCQARLNFEDAVVDRAKAFFELYRKKLCPVCSFEIWMLYHSDDWLVTNDRQLSIPKALRLRSRKVKPLLRRIPCADCESQDTSDKYTASEEIVRGIIEREAEMLKHGGSYEINQEIKKRPMEKHASLARDLARGMRIMLVNGVKNEGHRKAILDTYAKNRFRAMYDLSRYIEQAYCEWTEKGLVCDKIVPKWSKVPYCEEHYAIYDNLRREKRTIDAQLRRSKPRESGVLWQKRR